MKNKKHFGKVILAGAGPGDPGLLTLKAAEALRSADVIVYDWLANPAFLELAPQAEKIYVGKKGGTSYIKQEKIHRILLERAGRGKHVVRLKGGDPFIFGRGGEEALFLRKNRIPFEVIPGVSAGTGAPAYAGIPLTDRKLASQVTFVTGHEDPTKDTPVVDWRKLAEIGGTLVSFMGVKSLPAVVRGLTSGGKSPQTPAAVIEWGTHPHQRVVEGRLKDIVQKCRRARIDSPALTVIGEVVSLRKKLAKGVRPLLGQTPFGRKSLEGKTVVVTRARAQASDLVRKLSEKGARVVEFPTIEILPPSHPEKIDREILRLHPSPFPLPRGERVGVRGDYDWVIFTSANGVRFFFERMKALKKDARVFSGVRIAAIGEKTAEALQAQGLKADLVPREFTSRALFESLKKSGEIRGKKFLLARADIAPPDLRKALEKEGAIVTELEAYRTSRRPIPSHPTLAPGGEKAGWLGVGRLLKQKIDYVTFTSSSTVKNFFEALPAGLRKKIKARFVTIGPVTSRTLREYGFRPFREAKTHTIEGMVRAILNGGAQ